MKKSSQDYRAILRGHESGLSLRKIGARLGYPASSVKRVLDIAAENDLTWMTVKSMTDQALLEIFEPPRRQLMRGVMQLSYCGFLQKCLRKAIYIH